MSVRKTPLKAGDTSAIFAVGEPAFLLNAPFSLDTKIANNATMQKLGPRGRRSDRGRAFAQWFALYRHMAARSLVYLLPSRKSLQDQPFVANLGLMIARRRQPAFVLSRFRARGRGGEPAAGRDFFRASGVAAETSPAFFEGEADCKLLRDNIYMAGHGLRSSLRAHDWLRERHGLKIVPVPLHDPHLYHLDCVLHVLGRERVMLATAACPAETVRRIAALADIVDVPLPLAYRGATNVARLGGELLGDSLLPGLARTDPLYDVEKRKLAFWSRLGLEPVSFDLSEFHKSGAMLSCLVLPLTHPHLTRS